MATDPNPFGGRSAIEVTKPEIDTDAAPVSAFGVAARISQHAGRILLHLRSERRHFKYLAYEERGSPTRLVVDLWKAKPPSADAEFPTAPNRAPCEAVRRSSRSRSIREAQLPRARSAASSSIRSCSRSATGEANEFAWFR
jgi:hypothetical protein